MYICLCVCVCVYIYTYMYVCIYMCVCVYIYVCVSIYVCGGFPGSSVVKNLPANAGDPGSIPGSGRSPGGGQGNLLQYSCLENSMDRGVWWATVRRVTQS